jgi:predicted metalloprotease with PDZ domain
MQDPAVLKLRHCNQECLLSSGPQPTVQSLGSRAQSLKPILAALIVMWAAQASAQTLQPIRYTLSFPAPHTHYLEVEASYPTDGRTSIDLMMAVWTPGSYLIREYERHVEALTAADAARVPLAVEKTRKNRWRITTNGATAVWVRYRVYAHEMSVRTNWVDDEFAMVNGAPTFITLLESPLRRAHEVRVVLPKTWTRSFSAMPAGLADNTYVARDYDALVDSPIVAGSPSVYEFNVRGKPHYLVNFRERGVWNGPQAARDLAKVADAIARFWGDMPFDRFYFFNVIGSAENGLEHKSSTMLNVRLDATRTREGYLKWLSLASHEYFHAWNVKRLRPVELGPFDYENEVYTRALWFVEGITDYYADLFLARSGVATREEYFGALSQQIRSLQTTPGRLEQSVEQASYDAWIKYYRPDENTPNSAIDYYVKGAVIGFVLDAHIRRATAGDKSLDDVMRLMYTRFSGDKGFSRDELRATAADVVGPAHARDVLAWLARALETTSELEYADALAWFGLRMTTPPSAPRVYLGVATRIEDGKTIVSGIRRGSPAAAARLSLLDEITAINGEPLEAGELAQRLARVSPGSKIILTTKRRNETRTIELVLPADPGHAWELSPSPAATREQSQHLDTWLAQ